MAWTSKWNNTLGAHTIVDEDGFVQAISFYAHPKEMRMMAASYEMTDLIQRFLDINVAPTRGHEVIIQEYLDVCLDADIMLSRMETGT